MKYKSSSECHREAAEARQWMYSVHGFGGSQPLHPKADYSRMECALGKCQSCGNYKRPDAEVTVAKRMKFYCFLCLYQV